MASYLGKYGIRVNCVCPGGIWDHQREEFVRNYNHRCPMKRMGNPDDIAPPVSLPRIGWSEVYHRSDNCR